MNGKRTAFIQRFSNQWPLKALYDIASHSPVRAHIHTPTAESTTQGDSQLVKSSQGEASRSTLRGRSRGSNQRPSGYQPTTALPPEPHAAPMGKIDGQMYGRTVAGVSRVRDRRALSINHPPNVTPHRQTLGRFSQTKTVFSPAGSLAWKMEWRVAARQRQTLKRANITIEIQDHRVVRMGVEMSEIRFHAFDVCIGNDYFFKNDTAGNRSPNSIDITTHIYIQGV